METGWGCEMVEVALTDVYCGYIDLVLPTGARDRYKVSEEQYEDIRAGADVIAMIRHENLVGTRIGRE